MPGKSYRGDLDPEGMMDTFNPNRISRLEWATFIPRHRGSFHMHKDRGAALRAMASMVQYAILYRDVNGEWVEIARTDARTTPHHCDRCGVRQDQQPIVPDSWGGWTPTYLSRQWIKNRGKVVDPPELAYLCHICGTHNR